MAYLKSNYMSCIDEALETDESDDNSDVSVDYYMDADDEFRLEMFSLPKYSKKKARDVDIPLVHMERRGSSGSDEPFNAHSQLKSRTTTEKPVVLSTHVDEPSYDTVAVSRPPMPMLDVDCSQPPDQDSIVSEYEDSAEVSFSTADLIFRGVQTSFFVDARGVGLGELQVVVTASDLLVPVVTRMSQDGSKCYTFDYTPMTTDDHIISVMFNNLHVKGSPFRCRVMEEGETSSHSTENLDDLNGDNRALGDAAQWDSDTHSGQGIGTVTSIQTYPTPRLQRREDMTGYSETVTSIQTYPAPRLQRRDMTDSSPEETSREYYRKTSDASDGPMPDERKPLAIDIKLANSNNESRFMRTSIPPRRMTPPPSKSFSQGFQPRMILPKQVLEDIVSYRAKKQLKHAKSSSGLGVVIGGRNPNTKTHLKITEAAFKIGIEKDDHELLDVVVPAWKSTKDDPTWHPMIQIAKANKAGLFTRLHFKHDLCIPEPHDYFCNSDKCCEMDSLKHALLRINTYKALAQPAHLLSREDPIKTAFDLRWQMMELGKMEKEFKSEYDRLSEDVELFCCNMVKLCGKATDLDILLDRSHDSSALEYTKLGTVQRASSDKAKMFIAHEFIQRHLQEKFYGKSTQQQRFFLEHSNVTKFLFSILSLPVQILMIIGYIFLGGFKSLVEKWPIPFYYINALKFPVIKFYIHTTSYCFFLVLLIIYTVNYRGSSTERSTMLSWEQWSIGLYILGYAWAEIKQLYFRGYRQYFSSMFNWLDSSMVTIYFASYTCRIVAFIHASYALNYRNTHPLGPFPKNVEYYLNPDRKHWDPTDAEIIADSLFAIANVLSFARLSYILPAFEFLGPLLTTLGKVLVDTMYFMALFVIVFAAFLVGIHNLYVFHADENKEFGTVPSTFVNLFWAMFCMTDSNLYVLEGQAVVQTIGFLLFGTYHVLIVVMLLNMLIAMLSTLFENTDEKKDIEWKYARTGLWLDYIVKGDTLPVPFNILLTTKSIFKNGRKLFALCSRTEKSKLRKKEYKRTVKRAKYTMRYGKLMKKLKLKYANSFLNGEEIVVSINHVDEIRTQEEEPRSTRVMPGGGEGDIPRTSVAPVTSSPTIDEPDSHSLREVDPVRELLFKYFKEGTFGGAIASDVYTELKHSRPNLEEEEPVSPQSL